jgi:DNA-binding Lrp family transcriptional regulator
MFAVTAVADPRVLGLASMAWIGFVAAPSQTNALADALLRLAPADYVAVSSGRFNVMAEVACASEAELRSLVLELRALPGVERIEPFVYLALAHQQFQWAPPGEAEPIRGVMAVRGALPDLAPLDIDIIRELGLDGRASFRDIARRLGVSERVVSERFTQLVEGRILKVMAVGNPLNLGMNAIAWLAITTKPRADRDGVVAALGRIPAIDYVVAPTGRYDLMAELVCRDREELVARLADDVGAIDGIAHVETFFYLRLLFKSSAGAWGVARSLAPERRSGPASGIRAAV